MPSILKSKNRRVLSYFHKYGFENINLTLYIMDSSTPIEKIINLEQHYIDLYRPLLNVDLIAKGSGYHSPMSPEMREKLQKERGTLVYMYDLENLELLYVFPSKENVYLHLNMHHKTLKACLSLGEAYLSRFFFSLEIVEEYSTQDFNISLGIIEKVKVLLEEVRKNYERTYRNAKKISAIYKDDSSKNLEFASLNSLAKHLKGDRQVIRDYVKGVKSGYYRGKWKFIYKP